MAIRLIPAARLPVFCASCAERFFEGDETWLAEETSFEPHHDLPSPSFVRNAIDVCWAADGSAQPDSLLQTLIRTMPGENEQPIFKSTLNDYFVEPWLVRLGLSCVRDPQVNFGLSASAAAFDFHSQILDRRRDMAGVDPPFDDLERDLREFANDPGVLAEEAIQIEDAEQLRLGGPDWTAMRRRSEDHGHHVLEQVLKLVRQ